MSCSSPNKCCKNNFTQESDSGITTSIWFKTAPDVETDGPLMVDITADVIVVGAGIAGMTTAYLLAQEGRDVIVIDDGPVGGGMTGRTTGHLTCVLDNRYYNLERLHGANGSKLAAESHARALDLIEKIVNEEGIACEFERLDGYLFASPERSLNELDDELAACHRAGLTDVEMVDRAPIKDFDTGRCLRFPRQAQFHSLLYVAGLARAIRRKGGRIYTQTHVKTMVGGKSARVVTRAGNTVTGQAIIVATNTPVNNRVVIHTKQAGYLTYVIGARIQKGSVQRALLWDTSSPYHYVRIESIKEECGDKTEEYDVLIVGGEDAKTGQHDDGDRRYRALEQWARERYPMIKDVLFRWSGQVMESVDSLAFIGQNPMDADNVFIATGDSGNGLTYGTIAGMLLTDLISGRENRWKELYNPSRITFKAACTFVKENMNVALHYVDLITPGEVTSEDEVKAGEGAVMRRGLKKIALYRDEAGILHQRSAFCTHLGCVVDWNSSEKTWDCPCHGSRFDAFGKVFQGPANRDLDSAE